MRIFKVALVVALAGLISGCSCRAKTVGLNDGGAGNIATASDSGPLADIYFDFDRYELTDGAKTTAQNNSEYLKANPRVKVEIEGHADERGTNEYNMVLGSNRARAAHDYLRSLGVDASRMSTISYGEEIPVDPRSNEAAWSKNRRVHFKTR